MNVEDVTMVANDANVDTVGQYMLALARAVWQDEMVKRPFGNSDWQNEIYGSLARANLISREIVYQDEEYIEYDYDSREGDEVVMEMFAKLLDPQKNADHAVDMIGEDLLIRHPPLCNKNECHISKAAVHSVLPVPDKDGRYPIWVDHKSGELRIE